jgi:microcin C transport system substrate-binding protein
MRGLLFLFLGVLVSSAYGASPFESRIRVGFAGYPISNLYYLGFDDYSEAVTSLVLEPLVRLNLDSLEPEPSLANWFSVNRDHTRFEFTLDPKAKFSDDSPVTSEDVLFTWNILKSSANQVQAYASLFMDLTDCQISQGKIIFSSKRPVPLGMTLFSQFYVLSKKHFSAGTFTKDFNERFIGSGPYVFDSVKWGHSISLNKNPRYWGHHSPLNNRKYLLNRIEFHTQSDPSLLFQMLIKHEIDYLYFLSAKSWAADTHHPLFQKGTIRKLEVANRLSYGMAGIAWNMRKPLFQDRRVRKALALLFNRKRLIHDFFYDQYQPTTGIAYFGSEYHHPDNHPLPYDPPQALKLLTEAGWTLNSQKVLEHNGQTFSFEILTGNPPAAKYLALYQEDLRKLGIRVSIRVVDWGTYLKLRNQGQFEALDFSRNRDEFMTDLDMTWNSKGSLVPESGNITGFSNSKVDELLAALHQASSPLERRNLVQKLDKLIADDFPMAFSWEPRFQRIAFWNEYTFNGRGYHHYSKWNQIFNEWQSTAQKSQ